MGYLCLFCPIPPRWRVASEPVVVVGDRDRAGEADDQLGQAASDAFLQQDGGRVPVEHGCRRQDAVDNEQVVEVWPHSSPDRLEHSCTTRCSQTYTG